MNAAWVVFRPLDVVVFRDGRPFSAGASASARTTFPRPSSTAGAITAVFGGVEPREVTGPLIVDTRPPPTLQFPSPADLVFDDGPGKRLTPKGTDVIPVVTDMDEDKEAGEGFRLLSGRGEPAPALVTIGEMQEYLDDDTDGVLEALESRLGQPADALGFGSALAREPRLGLARDGRAAQEGFLYAAEFLRFLNEESAFACRVVFDGDIPPAHDLVRLGGEARQAEVSVFAEEGSRWLPSHPASFPAGRLLLYLATPAVFTRGWLPDPDPKSTYSVVAACVSGPDVAASWSAGQPASNPVRWAVAAGGVYFLQFATDEDAQHFANRWHGRGVPQAVERLRTAGFGMCLIGRW